MEKNETEKTYTNEEIFKAITSLEKSDQDLILSNFKLSEIEAICSNEQIFISSVKRFNDVASKSTLMVQGLISIYNILNSKKAQNEE
jgi:hypothetical protein